MTMRPNFPALPMLCATGLIVATPAAADVTPRDVWANLQAAMAATGATVSADVTGDDGNLVIGGIVLDYTLPMGAGSFSVRAGTVELTDNGDGTVRIGGPETQQLALTFDIPEIGSGRVDMGYAVSGYQTTASGDPGDVTYTYDIASYSATFDDMSFSGEIAEEVGDVAVSGGMTFSDLSGTYRITEGDLVTIASDGAVGSGEFDFGYEVAVPDEGRIRSVSTGTFGEITGETEFALPAGGTSLLALATALREGMSFTYSYSAGQQSTKQETYLGDELMMSQTTALSRLAGGMTLDANGLRADGTADDYNINFSQPMLFSVPVDISIGGMEVDMTLPLLRSAELQQGVFRMVADAISIDPELWALFDPGAVLPRDPARLAIDVTADLEILTDLLDFETLATGDVPVALHALEVADLTIEAVGAKAEVVSSFTFDNSDLFSFDGFPAPDGSATVTLTGANALLERLAGMGLLDDQDMAGANMVLGGFTRPGAAADERVTEIVIDGAAGTITANGQRLK